MLTESYVALEATVLLASSLLLVSFVRKFRARWHFVALILFPAALFALGFSLRLSGEKTSVDAGYFLTEFSFLFVYILFAASLLLGQIKYWKAK